MKLCIGKDGQDILEENARLGEVRELAQRRLQLYLKTGEFGGGGGMGGGESSLGGMTVALEGGVRGALGRVSRGSVALERRVCGRRGVERAFAVGGRVGGGGHYEEKKEREEKGGAGWLMVG